MTPPKPHNFSTNESKTNVMAEMSDKEFKSLLLKITNDIKRINTNR
jgi:hypothetical protein